MKHTWTTPAGSIYTFYKRLLSQKHLLIAGASGSGKSVIVNGIMHAALSRFPGDGEDCAQFILIDPKRVELSKYKGLPHTLVHATEPAHMVAALEYALQLTEYRFRMMEQQGVELFTGGDIYVIIDEFADLACMARKRVFPLVQRISQIGRAARVHLILCTQCPLAKIIPTEIKCNFDSVLALHTRSAQDSRNIIGESGCELLPAHGSAKYTEPGLDVVTVQGIPMIPKGELLERVRWWERQARLAA